MTIHTTSEGITLAKKLENDAATFYEALAKKFPEKAETFQNFAKENKKYIMQTERCYYEVITDAIEGCFAFQIEPKNYALDTALPKTATLKAAVKKALEVEDTIIRFYTDAAEQSKSIMADVPRLFSLIARKRAARVAALKSL
jgi:rubrerythrin